MERHRSAACNGGLEATTVRRVIRRHLKAIQQCYVKALTRTPRLIGTVRVAFRIAPSGRVERVSSVSTLLDGEATRCIERQVASWTFPPAKTATEAAYPFNFQCTCDYVLLHNALILRWIDGGRKGPPPKVPPHDASEGH